VDGDAPVCDDSRTPPVTRSLPVPARSKTPRPAAPSRDPRGERERSAAGPREVIGWTEYVELPDWGIPRLRAKVDTGARTSALHVDDVRRLPGDRVRFDVVLHRKRNDRRVTVEAPILRQTRVRSSTGVYRRRYVVPARIRLGHVDKTIEVSLVARDKMIFRMLLGRSAFSGEFLIDASRQCIQGVPHSVRIPKTRGRKTS
jgi:hypothetical protein